MNTFAYNLIGFIIGVISVLICNIAINTYRVKRMGKSMCICNVDTFCPMYKCRRERKKDKNFKKEDLENYQETVGQEEKENLFEENTLGSAKNSADISDPGVIIVINNCEVLQPEYHEGNIDQKRGEENSEEYTTENSIVVDVKRQTLKDFLQRT